MADGLATGEPPDSDLYTAPPSPVGEDGAGDVRADRTGPAGKAPPVNIRLSFPFPLGRWYLTVFAGRERRSPERLAADRAAHPLRTFANAGFVVICAWLFWIVAALCMLLWSSVLDF